MLAGALMLLMLLALGGAAFASANLQVTEEPERRIPSAPADAPTRESPTVALYRAPGRVIAQGTNTQPVGNPRVRTYVLEEVALPAGPPAAAAPGQAPQQTVLRLSVLGGPFRVGAQSWIVWVDDVPLRGALQAPDLDRLTVPVFDRSVLRSGAAISVSYGLDGPRQRLPEPLQLGDGLP
jgi:hypothetical protein